MSNKWFAFFEREGPFVAVDGEMYYGTPWPAKNRLLVDGHVAAERMVQHSYNTFSHHNSYWPLDSEATPNPKNKSLNFWMETALNATWLLERQLPITAAFAARSAQTGGTVADYIRQHLGYRLELISAEVDCSWRKAPGGGLDISLSLSMSLTNNGFAAPVNTRVWAVHLLEATTATSTVAANATVDASAAPDWRTFYPVIPGDPLRSALRHTVKLADIQLHVPKAGAYQVGFSLQDPLQRPAGAGDSTGKHSVRFTNAETWVAGINVLGSITLG